MASVSNDYFEILGISEQLNPDISSLQQRFYQRSRELHPDRYSRKPEAERNWAIEASSALNDAWRTLRDPLLRAEYVLTRHGHDLGEQRTSNVPPELLEEVFELNMALEELRDGDASVRPQLEQARKHFVELRSEIDAQLPAVFTEFDNGGGDAALTKIRGLLNRRRYISNLIRDVEKELEGAAA